METIFDDVFASERKRKPSEILAWMRTIREADTTGVLRLFNPPENRLIFHHYRGRWIPSSPLFPEGNEIVDLVNDIELNEDMFVKFIPLSTHGLVHSHLLNHAEIHQKENGSRSSDLPGILENHSQKSDPYLVKMKWENAAGSILFNGVSNLPHSLYISENMILDEPGISTTILQRKDDPSCVVSLFSYDPSLDVWRELRLRRSFKLLCDRLLERFELIAGRAIVESSNRIIAAFTQSNQIDISVLKRQLVINEFYTTSQGAVRHYQPVFQEVIEHFSAVIGSRLLSSNLRDVYNSLAPDVREDLEYYKILQKENLL